MNGEYLRSKSDDELVVLIKKFEQRVTDKDEKILKKSIPLIRDRMKLLSEYWTLAGFFFNRPVEFERPLTKNVLFVGSEAIKTCDWTHDVMEQTIRAAAEKAGLKARDVFMELRVAITGKTVGPPLLESIEILGKEETLARL